MESELSATIPEALQNAHQWLLWGNDETGAKRCASVAGRWVGSTWTSEYMGFERACEALQNKAAHIRGLAFCFTENDPFVGIDLDNCLRADGAAEPWAVDLVAQLCATYGEVSPSGNGIKFYGIGERPRRNICKLGTGQIEIYSHGRFFAVTGEHYDGSNDSIAGVQEILRDLESRFFENDKKSAISPQTSYASLPAASSDIEQRARNYIAKCGLPDEGGRNIQAFSIAGHLAAIRGLFNERLSEPFILQCLEGWNASLRDPLSDDEIVRATANGIKAGSPRVEKIVSPISVVPSDVELEGIVDKIVGEKPEASGIDSLLEAPGFLNELSDYIEATALYPSRECSFSAALALLSTITGRKIECAWSGTRSNLYVVLIAPSGSGKDHARRVCFELLNCIDQSELAAAERIASGAGLMRLVEANPACLLMLDEFDRLLASTYNRNAKWLQDIQAILMSMYTSSNRIWRGDAYADINNNPVIHQPHPVLYATATPKKFWDALESDSLADGLAGRLCLFIADYVDLNREVFTNERKPIPDSLIEKARFWFAQKEMVNAFPEPTVYHWHESAILRLQEHTLAISERRKIENETEAAIWSRASERACRFALLFAASRNPKERKIKLEDIDRAIALSNALTRRLIKSSAENLSSTVFGKRLLRMLRLIREAGPKGIDQTKLRRRFAHINNREFVDLVDTLVHQEKVKTEPLELEKQGRKYTKTNFVLPNFRA